MRTPDADGTRTASGGAAERRPGGQAWDVSPVLEVWIDPEVDSVTVEMAGTLTAESAAQIRPALMDAAKGGERDLTVDLSEVEFVDAAGLGVLVDALPPPTSGAGCRLVSPSRPVLRALEATGRARMFPIVLGGSRRLR